MKTGYLLSIPVCCKTHIRKKKSLKSIMFVKELKVFGSGLLKRLRGNNFLDNKIKRLKLVYKENAANKKL